MKPVRFLPIAFLLLAGCGGGDVLVEGLFLVDGAPYQSDSPEFMVSLTDVVDEGTIKEKNFPAVVSADGSFKVPGYYKTGIPPGKYRICIYGGKFGKHYPPGKSPLVIDVDSRNSKPIVELRDTRRTDVRPTRRAIFAS